MNWKKIVGCALAGVFGVTMLAGCTQEGGSPSGGDETVYDKTYAEVPLYEGGTHIYNVTETSYPFLTEETTPYRIVLSATAGPNVMTAANELITFFKEATGVTLRTVTDGEASWSETAQYISLGTNSYQQASGVTAPEGLKANGYVIRTQGRSVILFGGQDLGTQFGVYELLRQLFGYVRYGVDTYYIESGVKDKNLPQFDIYDNPDFDYTGANYGSTYSDKDAAHKMRTETVDEIYMTATAEYVHNTMDYLPPEEYEAKYPEWYATNTTPYRQLCYTAHGNPERYEQLVNEMTEKVKVAIDAEPNKSIISITNEDRDSTYIKSSDFSCRCFAF